MSLLNLVSVARTPAAVPLSTLSSHGRPGNCCASLSPPRRPALAAQPPPCLPASRTAHRAARWRAKKEFFSAPATRFALWPGRTPSRGRSILAVPTNYANTFFCLRVGTGSSLAPSSVVPTVCRPAENSRCAQACMQLKRVPGTDAEADPERRTGAPKPPSVLLPQKKREEKVLNLSENCSPVKSLRAPQNPLAFKQGTQKTTATSSSVSPTMTPHSTSSLLSFPFFFTPVFLIARWRCAWCPSRA